MKKDYRIYTYKNGTLHKHGAFKSGNAKQKHFYDDLKEAISAITSILDGKTQFIIVEYTEPYKSKIIKIVE